MLVLSRKKDQSIMIGDDVEIMVVEVVGNMVRLGIEAPNNVAVHRREIWEEIKKERRSPIHQDHGFWWFWDELWCSKKGPFDSRQEAAEALTKYGKSLEKERTDV